MSKTNHAKPEEFFKEQIRHLKKELKKANQVIRSLEKELGYSQNKTHRSKEADLLPDCPECGKGFLKEIEIVGRIFETCSLCKFRSKTKRAFKRKK